MKGKSVEERKSRMDREKGGKREIKKVRQEKRGQDHDRMSQTSSTSLTRDKPLMTTTARKTKKDSGRGGEREGGREKRESEKEREREGRVRQEN